MNDQTPPDSFDEEPKPRPLDGDREFPTIAQGSNVSKFWNFCVSRCRRYRNHFCRHGWHGAICPT